MSDPANGTQNGVDTEPLLSLRGIGRHFGSGTGTTHALRDITFDVFPGEFVAIIGPSGSGKSTLLNVLGLLDTASEGEYRIAGSSVSSLSQRQRDTLRAHTLGFVFQASHILPGESAAENAALGLRIQGVALPERRAAVRGALERLGILARAQALGKNLSGGERQRVAIARAIATGPRLLLADEPTGALDSENSARIIEHLHTLNAEGVTILVITHDPVVAASATRRLVLTDGRIREEAGVAAAPQQEPPHHAALQARPAHRTTPPDRRPARGRTRSGIARFGDEILEAISTHAGRPGRTMMLLFAFLLGAGGLVGSIGLSQSAAAQVSQRLTSAGLDEVVVSSLGGGIVTDPASSTRIRELEGVVGVGYRAQVSAVNARVSLLPPGTVAEQPGFTGRTMYASAEYLRLVTATTRPASAPAVLEATWSGDVALVGAAAARELGIAEAAPGMRIFVAGTPVEVIGIITSAGRESLLDSSVVLSPALADRVRGEQAELVVRTQPGYPAALAAAIPPIVAPGNPGVVTVQTVADLRALQRGVNADLGTLVGIISIVLLVLACLSAATSMYLTVRARAAEIALRRAVGASRAMIWRMFTLEGATIGAAGGLAGSAAGIAMVLVASGVQQWTPILDPAIIGVGVLVGTLTGIAAAAYPALVAARADPAQAIRE
ncbi:ATP-binding cassette domain-containing protein [Mycetocola tolaasinivorans]|uniref:ABC transporter ATP-binding protein/permease n=1 Tax=Mycetocola tolaasinivorans TaxID=76635 RepID=UPI0016030FEF|nr:ATP-binding cassette domain-containing protein [Mycetocola tolaasinivorans]